MGTYLQFVVIGLGVGAIYVGLANGLIVLFRATGIINFAMAAVGMWGGYVYTQMRSTGLLAFPVGSISFGGPQGAVPAVTAALLSAVVIAILCYLIAFRPVRNAPVLARVVMSIAVMLMLQALVVERFGPGMVQVQSIIPQKLTDVLGAPIELSNLYIAGIVVALSAAVWGYLRFARTGIATRAASGNERAAILMGYSPDRLAGAAAIVSALLATVAVLLASPLTGLSPVNYTLYVIPALAVMLVARMTSIPVATVFGLALGSLQALATFLVAHTWWPTWAASGLDQVIPFLVVMLALLAFGERLPARGKLQFVRLPDVATPSFRPITASAIFLAAALALVVTNGVWRFGITMSIIMMVLALSCAVITGYLGQVSLAQMAFAGAAGFTLSKFNAAWHLPFPITVMCCGLVAVALGVIVALPALRMRGAQLAIVTMAAALAIERFVFDNYSLTPVSGNAIADPTLFGLNLGVRQGHDISTLSFSIMALVVATLMVLLFVRVASGDLGRAFLAVRANERAAAAAGVDVRLTKMIGFAVSAFLAGVAGCLIGYAHGQLSASSFTLFAGLQVLAVAYIGGITSWRGAVIAGALAPLGIVYTVVNQFWDTGNLYALITSALLILTVVANPGGIADELPKQVRYVRGLLPRSRPQAVRRQTVSTVHRNVDA